MLDADQIEAFIGMEEPPAPQVPPAEKTPTRILPDPRTPPLMAGFAGLVAKIWGNS